MGARFNTYGVMSGSSRGAPSHPAHGLDGRGVRTRDGGYGPNMMDPRPTGIVVGLIGAVVLAISALADPLGIGEGHTFGWLQILGVILGAVILLLGLAIAAQRVPVPGRRRTIVTSGPENTTTIVEDPAPPPPPAH
jgi:hypothetical protein